TFSRTECAEHEIVTLHCRMAGVARRARFSRQSSISPAVSLELLKSPSPRWIIFPAILRHDINEAAWSFSSHTGILFRFKQVKYNDRPLRKPARSVTFHSKLVGVNVVEAPIPRVDWVLRTDQCTPYMNPLPVILRIVNKIPRTCRRIGTRPQKR